MNQCRDKINIVFICDENYVMPTIVAITSIYMNKNSDTYYSIHILANEISKSSRDLFCKLSREKFDVNVLEVEGCFENYKIHNLHVSPTALYKFNIANLFPTLDKILYLDGDILVQKDLSMLYQIDISNVYAAVVKDYKPMTYNPPQVKKLGINHSCYFNSGVMLLNLKKMREENLSEKLFDYRVNGINYFMDQDALNVVFEEKVIYLEFYYNVMSSVMGFFTFEDIVSYYELSNIKDKSDIYRNATIVHLCTKYKPWDYSNVPFADIWYFYYTNSPINEPLCRNELDIETRNKVFSEAGLQNTPRAWNILAPVIISFTSYPSRIGYVSQVVESLFNQTVKVDKILLWLAESQFPHKEKDLPNDLISCVNKGLEIRWCDDIGPHKKYFYAMQEFPDSIIITVDDDVRYSNRLVETLLNSYVQYPFAVSAMRAHVITFEPDGSISPYSKWQREYGVVGKPSLALCATGVGGVLYPPRIMSKELFNKRVIQETCLKADDLWLKIMQTITLTPVVVASKPQKLDYIEGSQEEALWKTNDKVGGNDIQLSNILKKYDTYWSNTDTLTKRIWLSYLFLDKPASEINIKRLKQELKDTTAQLQAIHKSYSYRIGRLITFIPRKIRGGIYCCRDHGLSYTLRRMVEQWKIYFSTK